MSENLPTMSDVQFNPADNLRIIVPRTSIVWAGDGDGQEVTARVIGYHSDSATDVWLQFRFRDDLGNPINISGEGNVIRGMVAEVVGGMKSPSLLFGDLINDGIDGLVKVKFTPCDYGGPGVYGMELMLAKQETVDGKDKTTLLVSQRAYMYCEKSMFSRGYNLSGPPPMASVRLYLSDSMGIENRIIDRLMWDNAQISQAFQHVVQMWNATPPFGTLPLTTRNIPSNYMPMFLQAMVAQLYMLGHEQLVRNDETTVAAGMTFSEAQRKEDYLRLAQMKMEEFKQFALSTKTIKNSQTFWSGIGSDFGGPGALPTWYW